MNAEKPAKNRVKENLVDVEVAVEKSQDLFDPARWKNNDDDRLDPRHKPARKTEAKVEVRKPPRDHYVRVHSSPEFNGVFPLYSDSDGDGYDPYLIDPGLELSSQVQANVVLTRLAVAITDTGKVFLWYVAQSGSTYHESGDEAIHTCMSKWAKVLHTKVDKGYRLEFPVVQKSEPKFPEWPFREYLRRAFKDKLVASLDHIVIRKLEGCEDLDA